MEYTISLNLINILIRIYIVTGMVFCVAGFIYTSLSEGSN